MAIVYLQMKQESRSKIKAIQYTSLPDNNTRFDPKIYPKTRPFYLLVTLNSYWFDKVIYKILLQSCVYIAETVKYRKNKSADPYIFAQLNKMFDLFRNFTVGPKIW